MKCIPFHKFAEATYKEYRILGYSPEGILFVSDAEDLCFRVRIPKRVMQVIRLFSDGTSCRVIKNLGIPDINKEALLSGIRNDTKKEVPEARVRPERGFWERIPWFRANDEDLSRDLGVYLSTVKRWRRKLAPSTELLIWLEKASVRKGSSGHRVTPSIRAIHNRILSTVVEPS